MAGRYKAFMENVDNRPYWQYVAVLDSRTRPAHRALHGKIFRYDDPFWDTHYPPLGWNCRCRVRALSQSDVDKKDLPISSSEGKITWEDQLVSKKTGELQPVAVYHDPVTGMKIPTDVGWSYNPGKAAWFPDLDKYPYDVAREWVQGGLTGPDFKAFYEGKIKGNFPVAVLDEEYKKAIKSKSQVVYLSDETLSKNKTKHPELNINDYQRLPEIISSAKLIIEKDGQFLVFIKQNGKYYFTVIKTTRNKNELYMTSFRYTNLKDIEDEKKKGRIIKDEL